MATGKSTYVDRGYAWCILAGSFVMYMLSVGSFKSYGILYTEMKDYYRAGSGTTAWVGSVCYVTLLGLAPVGNWLAVRRFTFRTVGMLGGVLTGLGYTLCVFIPRTEYMYVTFGLIVGTGYSFTYISCSTITSFYFEKNRALANGIIGSASGIGALVLPFLYRYLIENYALKGTFLIVGAIMLHICPAACMFVQPKNLKNSIKTKQQVDNTKTTTTSENQRLTSKKYCIQKSDVKHRWKTDWCPYIKLSLFRNPVFSLFALAFMMGTNGFINNIILIPSYTKDLGYDKTKVSLSVSIMGCGEISARLFFGWFSDRNFVNRKYIFTFSMVVSSLFCFIAPKFKSFEFIAVYAAIVGIFPGSFWSLMSVMVIDAVGMDNFAQAFGLLNLCLAFGTVLSQPFVGWLEDLTGDWHASFYLTGCYLLLAGIIVNLEPFLNSNKNKNNNSQQNRTELLASGPSKIVSRTESRVLTDSEFMHTPRRKLKIYRPITDNSVKQKQQTVLSYAPLAKEEL